MSTTNSWFKDSTTKYTAPSTPSNATTDVTTNATSEATATVCQECTAEGHASVCHVPQAPSSDFAVSKLSMLTGTIVVTEASRPVPKKIDGGNFNYQFYVDEIYKKYNAYNQGLVFAYNDWHRQIDEWCTKAIA